MDDDDPLDLATWMRAAALASAIAMGTGAVGVLVALGLARHTLTVRAQAVHEAHDSGAREGYDEAVAAWHRAAAGIAPQVVLSLGLATPPEELP